MTESLRLVEGQELEEGALVIFELHFLLNSTQGVISLKWLDASIILPDETLKLGRSIGQFRRGLGQDLVRIRLMHIVGHSFASLVLLVSLNETTLEWIVLLEFVVSSGLIVAEDRGYSQVF